MSRDRSMWRGKPGHQPPAPGPTGKYPRGQLNRKDRGELTIAIHLNRQKRVVELHFGTELTWLGLGSAEARAIGEALITHADLLDE